MQPAADFKSTIEQAGIEGSNADDLALRAEQDEGLL